MSREILIGHKDGELPVRYLLEIVPDGDHWASTLSRLNDEGEPEPTSVAPRFYGFTAEQARRRMVSVLENEYDEVATEPAA